jgi:hypothetical protein
MDAVQPCPCQTPGYVDTHHRADPKTPAYWVACKACGRTGREQKTEAAAISAWNDGQLRGDA